MAYDGDVTSDITDQTTHIIVRTGTQVSSCQINPSQCYMDVSVNSTSKFSMDSIRTMLIYTTWGSKNHFRLALYKYIPLCWGPTPQVCPWSEHVIAQLSHFRQTVVLFSGSQSSKAVGITSRRPHSHSTKITCGQAQRQTMEIIYKSPSHISISRGVADMYVGDSTVHVVYIQLIHIP